MTVYAISPWLSREVVGQPRLRCSGYPPGVGEFVPVEVEGGDEEGEDLKRHEEGAEAVGREEPSRARSV